MNKVFSSVRKKAFGLSILFSLSINSIYSQDSLKQRRVAVEVGTVAAYSAAIVGLHQLWYKDYDQSTFHTFNDNAQWLQVDKLGHVYSTYILSRSSAATFKWAGYSKEKAAIYGAGGSFAFLTAIEIMDGYSAEWGFSWGDFTSNLLGNGLFLGQELLFKKQVMRLKFSYTPSPYREMRTQLLGENELQGVLKDYNGQTYWASFNLNAISSNIKPKWLNLAVGFGGDGMVQARRNGELEFNSHRRQLYLGPDIDFEQIPTNKKWVKTVFFLLNVLKAPLPAIEYRQDGLIRMNWIAF